MAFGKGNTAEAPTETFGDAEGEMVRVHNQYLEMVEDPELVDPKAMALQIVNRILSADSLDALKGITASGTVDASDLMGTPFIVESISFHKSAEKFRENSAGVFCALTIRKDDGTSLVVTNGGENVVAICYKLLKLGAVPTADKWTFRANETSSGYTTYWLMPA